MRNRRAAMQTPRQAAVAAAVMVATVRGSLTTPVGQGTLRIVQSPDLPQLVGLEFHGLQQRYNGLGESTWRSNEDGEDIAFLTFEDHLLDEKLYLETVSLENYWTHLDSSIRNKYKNKTVLGLSFRPKKGFPHWLPPVSEYKSFAPMFADFSRRVFSYNRACLNFHKYIYVQSSNFQLGWFYYALGPSNTVNDILGTLGFPKIFYNYNAKLAEEQDDLAIETLRALVFQNAMPNGTLPRIKARFISEPNWYAIAFASPLVPVFFRGISGFTAMLASVRAMMIFVKRRQMKFRQKTPLEVNLILLVNAFTMFALSIAFAIDGWSTQGNLFDSEQNIFRTLFHGSGVACNALIIQVWQGILKKKTKTCSYIKAFALLMSLDLITAVCFSNFIGGAVGWRILPMILIFSDSVISSFLWFSSFKMLTHLSKVNDFAGAINGSASTGSGVDSIPSNCTSGMRANQQVQKFIIKATRIVLKLAICSIVIIIGLSLAGLQIIFYDSPAGYLSLGFVAVASRMLIAHSQISLCVPMKWSNNGKSTTSGSNALKKKFKVMVKNGKVLPATAHNVEPNSFPESTHDIHTVD